jgi:hypothetical protein
MKKPEVMSVVWGIQIAGKLEKVTVLKNGVFNKIEFMDSMDSEPTHIGWIEEREALELIDRGASWKKVD